MNFRKVGIGAGILPIFLLSFSFARDKEDVERFLIEERPGTFLTITLCNGSTVQGRLVEYDDRYDILWLEPAGKSGFFSRKDFRLSTIVDAQATIPQHSDTPK